MSLQASSIRKRRFAAAVLLSTIGFFTWSGRAAPEGGFAFSAPAACPTRADFVEGVRQRLPGDQRADASTALAALIRSVRIDDSAKHAEIQFSGAGATGAQRSVSAETCEELVASLALICAMALSSSSEGDAAGAAPSATGVPSDSSPSASLTAPSASVPTAPPSASVPPALPPAPSPLSSALPPVAQPSALDDADDEGEGEERVEPTSKDAQRAEPQRESAAFVRDEASTWGVGLGVRADGWTGPAVPLGLDAFVNASPFDAFWSARASLLHTRSQGSSEGRVAVFHLYASRVEGCTPFFPFRNANWVVEPCIGVSAGLIYARGLQSSELPLARQVYVPWFDAALIGRVRSPRIGPLRLEAQAEVGSALVTHGFRFDEPDGAVFEVRPDPALAARVGIFVPL